MAGLRSRVRRWTKADIDDLFDNFALPGQDWLKAPIGYSDRFRAALYKAAGLQADGSPQPEKVRCWMSPDPDWPEYPDFFYSEPKDLVEGRIVIPGHFIPDETA